MMSFRTHHLTSLFIWALNIRGITAQSFYTLSEHTDTVWAISVLGDYLYSASADKTVKQWDVTRQQYIRSFIGHTDAVTCVFADNLFVLTGGKDNTARVWSHTDATQLRALTGHTNYVTGIVRVNTFAYTACDDNFVRKYDVSTGTFQFSMSGHQSGVKSIAALNTWIFSGDATGMIIQWNQGDGAQVRTYTGHTSAVQTLTINNGFLYSGGADNSIRQWQIASGPAVSVWTVGAPVWSVQANSEFIYVASAEAVIRQIRIADGLAARLISGHSDFVTCIVLSGSMLYSGSMDWTVRAWDSGAPANLPVVQPRTTARAPVSTTTRSIRSATLTTPTPQAVEESGELIQVPQATIVTLGVMNGLLVLASAAGLFYLYNRNRMLTMYAEVTTKQSKQARRERRKRAKEQNIKAHHPSPNITTTSSGHYSNGSTPTAMSMNNQYAQVSHQSSRSLAPSGLPSPINLSSINLTAPHGMSINAPHSPMIQMQPLSVNQSALSATQYQTVMRASKAPTIAAGESTMSERTWNVTTHEVSVPSFLEMQFNMDFRPGQFIAQGGNAKIYRCDALNPALIKRLGAQGHQEQLVVKMFNLPMTEMPPRQRAAIFQELSLMYRFRDHPSFVKLYAYSTTPVAFILKFYQFGDMSDFIAQESLINQLITYSKFNVVFIMRQLCSAIGYMHQAGFVHLDIKPPNVLMDIHQLDTHPGQQGSGSTSPAFPVPIISDLGLTTFINPRDLQVNGFQVSDMRGASVCYAAPEVLFRLRNRNVSVPMDEMSVKGADGFSIAMVILEMLVRRPPWY